MAEDPSSLGKVIEFLGDIGIYDVVLPFLLIFTVSFAILEKTQIFGYDEFEGKKYPKKNLNAMTAFVLGFLVIASTKLVRTINEAMANIMVLLLVAVSFLLLIGSFYKNDEDVFLEGGWRTTFMIIMGVGVLLIFLNALDWLDPIGGFFEDFYNTSWFGAIVLIIVVIILMVIITRDRNLDKKKKSSHSDDH